MISFKNRSFGLSVNSIVPRDDFPRAKHIDLDRYMRDWYVIAHKPPSITRTAHNAVERYRRGGDNRIDVRFTFRQGGFNGKHKRMQPTGYVVPDTGNAVWAMQFIWPIKMQFVIAYVSADYRHTIVARERLDFVWIMSSEPAVERGDYNRLVEQVAHIGYNPAHLRVVPQQKRPADAQP